MRRSISRRHRTGFGPSASVGALLLGAGLLIGASAGAQSHQQKHGDYVLRSDLVETTALPESSLRKQDISAAPDQAVLNIVVLKTDAGSAGQTVPAEVDAQVRNLMGEHRTIELRQVESNGRVTYLGLVKHLPHEALDFVISARPQGSNAALKLSYREQMAQ